MKRASYREAIRWIADYDDTEWLKEEDPLLCTSVTADLITDIFGVTKEKVVEDLLRALEKMN